MTELPVTVTLAPDEQADINLALRSWAMDLEEPTTSRKLNAARRAMRRRIEALADRLGEAQIAALVDAPRCPSCNGIDADPASHYSAGRCSAERI